MSSYNRKQLRKLAKTLQNRKIKGYLKREEYSIKTMSGYIYEGRT